MEKTKLEKLARLSGKVTSKALDALGKHEFDIRGKLSAPDQPGAPVGRSNRMSGGWRRRCQHVICEHPSVPPQEGVVGLTVGDREFADSSLEGTGFEPSGPSLEQIVCLASRTVAIGEKIGEPDGRKAFAKSC